MKRKFSAMLSCAAVAAAAAFAASATAQQQQAPQPQAVLHRNLWIAKFTCDTKAASAVAATQRHDSDGLEYSNLFDSVTTFANDATPPKGAWSLTAKEVDFGSGSTAERALIGYGAGRAHITMEYKLADPSGKVVWTGKIKTKPSWWGSSGTFGAVQNQSAAEDQQAEKLIEALSKYFGVAPQKKR